VCTISPALSQNAESLAAWGVYDTVSTNELWFSSDNAKCFDPCEPKPRGERCIGDSECAVPLVCSSKGTCVQNGDHLGDNVVEQSVSVDLLVSSETGEEDRLETWRVLWPRWRGLAESTS
jgi:hypothetical protein